jgi:para-aminobenzoate N-oxygenase AurF
MDSDSKTASPSEQRQKGKLPEMNLHTYDNGSADTMDKSIDLRIISTKVPRLVRIPLQAGYKYFPEYSCNLFDHPAVQQAPEKVRHDLLVLQLYYYLRFTVFLELGPVTEVCKLLCIKEVLPWLVPDMKAEAFKIYTEEIEHAYMYHDVFLEIEQATAVAPLNNKPVFLSRIDRIIQQADSDFHSWTKLFFVIVSETLITNQLVRLPNDANLQPVVRELVREHAHDEARHHAFFKKIFKLTWQQLHPDTRQRIGVQLPDLIAAYLRPDEFSMLEMLQRFPDVFPEPQDMLNALFSPQANRARILTAALPTLQMFQTNGMFSDERIAEAFDRAGFMIPNH